MRDFERWFSDAGFSDAADSDSNLPEGITEYAGVFYAQCHVCGDDDVIGVDPDEIPDTGYMHFCNRTPWCRP